MISDSISGKIPQLYQNPSCKIQKRSQLYQNHDQVTAFSNKLPQNPITLCPNFQSSHLFAEIRSPINESRPQEQKLGILLQNLSKKIESLSFRERKKRGRKKQESKHGTTAMKIVRNGGCGVVVCVVCTLLEKGAGEGI